MSNPPVPHDLRLVVREGIMPNGGRGFRAQCSCGWRSLYGYTNAVMGNGRRHAAAMRRAAGRLTPAQELSLELGTGQQIDEARLDAIVADADGEL